MINKNETETKLNSVDLLTHSMFSIDFLAHISEIISSREKYDVSVGQFHDQWQARFNRKETIPFSLGAVVGFVYVGILFTKEHWFTLLPNLSFSDIPPEWGLKASRLDYPKKTEPKLTDVVRRIRNSLGHSRFTIDLPEETPPFNGKGLKSDYLLRHVILAFSDQDMKDKLDTFHIELPLIEVTKFIQFFQNLVYQHEHTNLGETAKQ